MSLNSKIVMSLMAGAFAALLAWVCIDFNPWYHLPQSFDAASLYEQVRRQLTVTLFFGCFVGAALGLVNGMFSSSGLMTRRYVGWGLAIGAVAGLLGLYFGQMFFGAIYAVAESMARARPLTAPVAFVLQVFARAIGWALIGLFVGIAQGVPINSKRAMRHGAIGGLIGGLLGGTMFELTRYILPPGTKSVGVIARGVGLPATGAAIGFFIGLVETLLKQAWIRVVQGRNEGREYIISKTRTIVGRNELADIGLFGDMNIAPAHAVIEQQSGRHVIHDGGAPAGTSLNGQKVKTAQLKDGDIIEIASMRLEFHEKATASKLAPPPVDVAPKPVNIPSMEGICPYCGTKKNASGQCACSVGAAGSPESQPDVGLGVVLPPQQQAPAPARGAGPRLVGFSGPYAGQVFSLSAPAMSIGREPGRDIQLPMDSTVSRNHASIRNEDGVFTVYDEGSSNGTTVNGTRVTNQPLSPGDTVQFGGSAFRFEV